MRELKTDIDERNRELATLKKTDRRAEKVLEDSDSRRSDDVSAGALLKMASVSADVLGDPSAGGWRDLLDKDLVSVIGKFVADIQNTFSKSDNSTRSICSWIEQLVSSETSKRLVRANKSFKADGT